MKQQRLFGFLSAIVISIAVWGDPVKVVHITTASGDVTDILVSEQPTVVLRDADVVIDTSDTTISIPVSEAPVMCITQVTGVSDIVLGNLTVGYNNHSIIVAGYPNRAEAAIYDINGMLYIRETLTGDDIWSYDTSALPSGTYILTIDNRSFKIFVK